MPAPQKTKQFFGPFFFVVALFIVIAVVFFAVSRSQDGVRQPSRIVMELAEEIVRKEKPTPTQSSRFYALVAREYYDTNHVTQKRFVYSTSSLTSTLAVVRADDDQEIATGTRPIGESYWVSEKKPFSPNAGGAKRFVLDESFSYKVPEPPLYGSEEFLLALAEVKNVSLARSAEQVAAINFWGGVPGSEQPAGIWQNRLYDITKKYDLTDKEYAYAQMVLAEAVADAFMECWKVKYTYWTKRPDMVDKTIQTAMPNPPFPGYVSGHSTISFAGATVLAKLFPGDAEMYLGDAEEAKNSRLWAGIHFSHDNEEGKKLGIAVGNAVILKLGIKPMR